MAAAELAKQLYDAIRGKDLKLTERCINYGADLNANFDDGLWNRTPLGWAIHFNFMEAVKILISRGANPNTKTNCTLLIFCIKNNRLEIAKYLLEMNANPCQPDNKGRTPLSWATSEKNIPMIESLLDYGAEFTASTALLEAIELKDLEIVRLLLQRGASANFTNTHGFTPLLKATSFNAPLEIVDELIENGADVNCSTQEGTPLIKAVDRCNLELVTRILKSHTDVNKSDQNGNYLIMTAINRRNLALLKLLVENGAKLDVKDHNGDTPFIKTVRLMNLQMVKYWVKQGIDLNEKDKNGHTATSIALSNFDFRTLSFLIESGADSSLVSEAMQERAKSEDNIAAHLETMKKKKGIKNTDLGGLSGQEDASTP